MIIAWLVGLLLTAITIYLYFGTEVSGKPVLSRLGLIAMVIFALIPMVNILSVIIESFIWMIQMCDGDWNYTRKPGKILKWLNERVKTV